jgi:hypothetical protein
MRPANEFDYGFMLFVSHECDLPPLEHDVLERCLGYIGEHGYFILDMQDDTHAIVHAAILPQGRGKWANGFFRSMLKWAFTATRLEEINALIPVGDRHVIRFGTDAGMQVVHATGAYTYLSIGLLGWMASEGECLQGGGSDYERADQEMVSKVIGACAMMSSAGMNHKAWYVYELYAKLFGYKVEA